MASYQHDQAVALASASRTTNQTLADINLAGAPTLNVWVDITANAGGLGSITVSINAKDPASGKYTLILASAALTGVATTRLKVGTTITAAANTIAQDYLPETVQLVVTANNANPVTYSVGYAFA